MTISLNNNNNNNNSENEKLFWKVFHNKFLFYKIINSIEELKFDYPNISTYYDLNIRKKFKNINDLGSMALYKQYSILKDKLKHNDYIHISSSSIREFIRYCDDKSLISQVYSKFKLEFNLLVNPISIAFSSNNIQALDLFIFNFNLQIDKSSFQDIIESKNSQLQKYILNLVINNNNSNNNNSNNNNNDNSNKILIKLPKLKRLLNLYFNGESIDNEVLKLIINLYKIDSLKELIDENEIESFEKINIKKFIEINDIFIQKFLVDLKIVAKSKETFNFGGDSISGGGGDYLNNKTIEELLIMIEIIYKIGKGLSDSDVDNIMNLKTITDRASLLESEDRFKQLKKLIVLESDSYYLEFFETYGEPVLNQGYNYYTNFYYYCFQTFNPRGLQFLIDSSFDYTYWIYPITKEDDPINFKKLIKIVLNDQQRVVDFFKLFYNQSKSPPQKVGEKEKEKEKDEIIEIKCRNIREIFDRVVSLLNRNIWEQLMNISGFPISLLTSIPQNLSKNKRKKFSFEDSIFYIEKIIKSIEIVSITYKRQLSILPFNFKTTKHIDYFFKNIENFTFKCRYLDFNNDQELIDYFCDNIPISAIPLLFDGHGDGDDNKTTDSKNIVKQFLINKQFKYWFKLCNILEIKKFESLIYNLSSKGNWIKKDIETEKILLLLKYLFEQSEFSKFFNKSNGSSSGSSSISSTENDLNESIIIEFFQDVIFYLIDRGIKISKFDTLINIDFNYQPFVSFLFALTAIGYDYFEISFIILNQIQNKFSIISNQLMSIDIFERISKEIYEDEDYNDIYDQEYLISSIDMCWLINSFLMIIPSDFYKVCFSLFSRLFLFLSRCKDINLEILDSIRLLLENKSIQLNIEPKKLIDIYLSIKSIKLSEYQKNRTIKEGTVDFNFKLDFIKNSSVELLLELLISDNVNQLYNNSEVVVRYYSIAQDLIYLLQLNEVNLYYRILDLHYYFIGKNNGRLNESAIKDIESSILKSLQLSIKLFRSERQLVRFIENCNITIENILYHSLMNNRLDFIKFLKDNNYPIQPIKYTSIFLIFSSNHLDIAKYLLSNLKDKILIEKSECKTLFNLLFRGGYLEMFQLLLEHYPTLISLDKDSFNFDDFNHFQVCKPAILYYYNNLPIKCKVLKKVLEESILKQ
ncbi:hypothetical protein ACTFIW_011446 [Dictyostelium discoideum]